MDAFGVLEEVLDDYRSFVEGFLNIRDEHIRATVKSEISDGLLWPEPWLALNPSFEPGGKIGELVTDGLLHPDCVGIFRRRTDDDPHGTELTLHRHQRDAVEIARRDGSYVLTTGTGSGKSLAYIVPIVDHVLRHGSGRGVQAIIVYPMNALANSQIGELEKFLGKEHPRVTFARYTGQESSKERDRILADRPDILLTNYVMLELMLVRPAERDGLIRSATNLRYLVLDELHTYRGRQGADVAMLMRRLRDAVGGRALQCIGTSATLAGPGTRQEQRAGVAALATRLFGVEFEPRNIVGETLRRATAGDTDPESLRLRLGRTPPATFHQLRTDPLAVWIEEVFGLRLDDERDLARQTPTRLADAAARLSEETQVPPEQCEHALRAALLAGAGAKDDDDRSLFAFKLHQFIGKGDTAYVTLEPASRRFLTTQYQRSAPEGPGGQPLFPLAFCRECGQEYLVVNREKSATGVAYTPRLLRGGLGEPVDAEGLLYLSENPWPPEGSSDLLELVPADWIVEDIDGRTLDPGRRTRLPIPVVLDSFGRDHDDGTPGAFFERLHFCPSCKTTYESARQSEFSRVASLGTEGRASAVTVLSQSVVRALRESPGVSDEARKFLAFSDNRQDASLQAGHFNDFVLVGLVRAALYAAANQHELAHPFDPLSDRELGSAVVGALGIDFADYARNPEAEFGARKRIDQALRESVTYRIYADLKRGWRITMPNLEQVGLLRLEYESLDEIAAAHERWEGCHPALASANATTRAQVIRVLLDELRRNLCVESEYLQEERYDAIRRGSQEWLKAPWSLTDERGIYAATCYAGRRGKGAASRGDLYLSGLGLYGRWLRRPDRFPDHDHPLRVADADVIIEDALKVLARLGLLATVEEGKRLGYRVHAGMLLWHADVGERRVADPLRGSSTVGRVNPYFKRFYQETASELAGLEAREHTAQVKPEDRRDREHAFGEATLPVLYCSPTMELGVDIRDLNVVGMRNVPPTPANYAQRSGRAGRSGQPAVVLTYCATGSAHDNYYFARSQEMVAGVVAPPRLELGNQDLVRAHAHAIWLVETSLDLKAKMTEVLDADVDGLPLHPDIESKIHSKSAASRAMAAISTVLQATTEVTSAPWWRDDWVERTVTDAPHAFERALDRWRGLYRDAHAELDAANDALKKINADEATKSRARGQISEARAALDLLRGDIDSVNQGDFYTYRYFASEGFLPGYSFPRLPLAAFIPAERKTKSGQGDYVQRPRFLAISEFGPGAFIYHEGARYEVVKVTLPAREDGTGVHLTEIKRCADCGYLNEGNGETGVEVCEQCDSANLTRMDRLMRLLAVKTRRRDRINADEEERQRAGYDIITSLRYEPHGERSSQQSSRMQIADGKTLAKVTYGDTALIRRMNVGLRRRKNRNEIGYLLNTLDGRWAKAADLPAPDAEDGGVSIPPSDAHDPDARIRRVVPYVEDHRNAMLLEFDPSVTVEARMAAMYALKRGIEALYQLEESELAAEPLPGRTGDHEWRVMLFFEAAEGGAGVLRRLTTEPNQLNEVARRALGLLHFDPDTGEDLGHAEHATERCAQACYDCLLSYGNQWDHQRLDRHAARDTLIALRDGRLDIGSGGRETREVALTGLAEVSNTLERHFLDRLSQGGYLLPTEAQVKVDDLYVQPDFAYRRADVDAAIFVDGPVHDHGNQAEKDRDVQRKLERQGWLVLRFHHEDGRTGACGEQPSWREIFEANPHIFGPGNGRQR